MERLKEDFDELFGFEDPKEIDLEEIEGKDPARARFIRGYLKESMA